VKLGEALTDVRLLGIETAPFIYFMERRSGYVAKMRAVFRRVTVEGIVVVASTITLTEALAKPLRENADDLVEAYRTLLKETPGILLRPVDSAAADRAALLRARYNLKTPDALHVATAIEAGCDAFLTNDLDLRRIAEIRVLALDDLELDEAEGEQAQ
jgi:predicted nucleic acid-binding protein